MNSASRTGHLPHSWPRAFCTRWIVTATLNIVWGFRATRWTARVSTCYQRDGSTSATVENRCTRFFVTTASSGSFAVRSLSPSCVPFKFFLQVVGMPKDDIYTNPSVTDKAKKRSYTIFSRIKKAVISCTWNVIATPITCNFLAKSSCVRWTGTLLASLALDSLCETSACRYSKSTALASTFRMDTQFSRTGKDMRQSRSRKTYQAAVAHSYRLSTFLWCQWSPSSCAPIAEYISTISTMMLLHPRKNVARISTVWKSYTWFDNEKLPTILQFWQQTTLSSESFKEKPSYCSITQCLKCINTI